jgi:xanthine dehydrogenase YagR molybdenum-binding subunit
LIVYDKTQGVLNSQSYITKVFGLPAKKVQVKSPFVGGAFGSGLRPQYQLYMAVLAALELKCSVKVSLTRQQMFSFGHRPIALQQLGIGAQEDGTLMAIRHTTSSETSRFENYVENIVNWAGLLYQCENVEEDHRLVPLDMYTPLDMRAPGAATGVYALECAMDELSYKLKLDPLELRIKNYTEKDPGSGKPFSSKALMECYQQAAIKFGWEKRNPEPRSMRQDNQLIGWGMATGIWDAMHVPARAHAILKSDGKLTVMSATADIGTGTYTIMTQIAAESLGLSLENVSFQLGDSSFPYAYLEGGSSTAASVGTAVFNVCKEIKDKLIKLVKKSDNNLLKEAKPEELDIIEGFICLKGNPTVKISVTGLMKQADEDQIEEKTTDLPNLLKQKSYAMNTHSAVFAEVLVDESLGTITVSRVVSAIAAGRILNPKTARSQIIGGIIWGISMALQEDSFMDHNFGRFMNHNLSEYHVPVNADIHSIDVIFVEEKDDVVSPIGVKGVGEIGLVGVASAVVNAIYHATGKRIRDLPVTMDKLL